MKRFRDSADENNNVAANACCPLGREQCRSDGIFYFPKFGKISKPNGRERLIVLMDIDATMLRSEWFTSEEEVIAFAASLPKDASGNTVKLSWMRGVFDKSWIIAFRPGLLEFIREVASWAELHIYTAGSQHYAMSVAMVINQMCGKNYFASDKIWSRERHVHFNKDGKHYKFLCVLPLGRKNLSRVVLIDDHKNHQEVNPGNVYRIAEFKGEIDDIELDRALNFLKDKLKDCDDVRPVLSARQEEADSWAKMSLWKHQDVRILFASKWLEIV